MIWAVIAAKLGPAAKGRLTPALEPAARAALAEAMLSDVLATVAQVRNLAGAVVVSSDPAACALATAHGFAVIDDPGLGLNAAVAAGMSSCARAGGDAVIAAMADIPLVTTSELEAVIARLPERGLAASPSRDGTGTNLLAVRPAELIVPRFGPGSLARHRQEALRAGVECVLVPCEQAALDIDTPGDLDELGRRDTERSRAARLLASLRGYRAATAAG